MNTDLYIFSAFGVPEDRKAYYGNNNIKGYFTKPLTTKEIRKIFADYHDRTKGNEISFQELPSKEFILSEEFPKEHRAATGFYLNREFTIPNFF
ncbi:MAG: hypothetical protein WA913_17335 [Pricia sp.]